MGALTRKTHLKADSPPIGSHAPIAHGWDTVVEAYDLFPIDPVISALEQVKARAVADDEKSPIRIAGHLFWVLEYGVRSWPWVLVDDEGRFTLKMRARAPTYGVMVEYRSAALWERPSAFDWSDLQEEIYALLREFCAPKGEREAPPLVNRADFAFDFYAPEFSRSSTPELYKQWSAHQEVKRHMRTGDFWGRRRIETWTLGNKKSLELQVYDKSRQLTEVAGKDWMVQVHEANAKAMGLAIYAGEPVDVWRLEVRMGKDWLKRRWFDKKSARERHVFIEHSYNLVQDALSSIQLKIPEGPGIVQQLDRRPAHWFWGVASETVGGNVERPHIARLTTGRRKALSDMFRKSVFGYMRALSVLETGDCDEDTLGDLLDDARAGVLTDPEHRKKVDRADRRYVLVDRT